MTDGTATGTITDDDESAGAPTGLTASTGSGEGEIDLSWTAPSDTGVLNGTDPATITGYQYRRAESQRRTCFGRLAKRGHGNYLYRHRPHGRDYLLPPSSGPLTG